MSDFRVGYLDEYGEPLAVFLDRAHEAAPGRLLVYAHNGEHAEAVLSYLSTLPPAGEPLYRSLHDYLANRYAADPGDPLNLIIDQEGLPR